MTTAAPDGRSGPHGETTSLRADFRARAELLRWLLRGCWTASAAAALGFLWLAADRLMPGAVPHPPAWGRVALLVLASGGVGFGTNWLAIKMLFRPHRPVPWMVLWRQGLIPREQARFARVLGEVAAQRLLSPDAIVSGLEDERLRIPLGRALRSELETLLAAPSTRRLLIEFVTDGLREHGPEVIRRLRPELRAAIERAIDEHVTAERVLHWMRGAVTAFAQSADMRRAVARWLFNETSREGSIRRIMDVLQEHFLRYRERHPIRGFLAEQFVIDWDDLRDSLVRTLQSEESVEELAAMLVDMAGGVMDRLGDPRTGAAVAELRGRLTDRVLDWFEQNGVPLIAQRLAEAADQPAIWNAVGAALDDLMRRVPDALFSPDGAGLRPEVREHLGDFQRRVVAAFPVAEIVERQVLAMDPAMIERVVDDAGNRELAWIQILGFILGAAAGGMMAVLI